MLTIPDAFRRTFRAALLGLVLLEVVSFWGFLFPAYSSAAFLLVVAATVVLAVVDPLVAMIVLFSELFVGSQGGYLLAYGTESGLAISLRIGLFLAVFGAWVAVNVAAVFRPALRASAWRWYGAMRESKVLWPYVALMAAFAMAGVRGVLHGNSFSNVFFDANGYAYFALVPAVVSIMTSREAFAKIGGALAASIVTSVSKALFIEFLFSHRQFYYAKEVYVWVRDTRVGEITLMGADFYRVFFQSQVWLLLAAFPLVLGLAYSKTWKGKREWAMFGLTALAAASMLLSLSRSFWFGAGVGVLAMLATLVWAKAKLAVCGKVVFAGVSAACVGFFLIAGLYAFPWPSKTGNFDFAGFLGGRAFTVAGEAAANSRWALLPILNDAIAKHPVLGSGFGTTTTYRTSDPRLLADNPTGEYTTFAFEWGYHDLFLKLGAVGVAAYAWFLWAVLWPFVRAVRAGRASLKAPALPEDGVQAQTVVVFGALLGLVAMLATNLFSPYLNHPLGIGMLALAAAAVVAKVLRPE